VAALVSSGGQDFWSAQGTTPDAVEEALRRLLRERHAHTQGLVPARVLNLVVVIDRELRGEVANRLQRMGRNHPSRTIVCSVGPANGGLDARAILDYQAGNGAGVGVIREQVEFDLIGAALPNLAGIVDPVLVSELPTLLWCPHGHGEAVDAMLGFIDAVMLDSDEDPEPAHALVRAHSLAQAAHVVDLAWLRTTPWRERLAATFDPPYRRTELPCICAVEIRHRAGSTASAVLLAGWLAGRLGWCSGALSESGEGISTATAKHGTRRIEITLSTAEQDARGLAGITVTSADGFSVSLDRGPGGLKAVRTGGASGTTTSWQVLGASRGEGGILGEGVRQALLRDPLYAPALGVARELCPA
jgi:glucose-6-phosphate dehydrogenase assembly protein OpcA